MVCLKHAFFFKKNIDHSDFIGDSVNSSNIPTLNSYRKLIHCIWIGENIYPMRISFEELCEQTNEFEI